jgi:ATP-binding cassette subfamily F protein 3
MKWVMHMIILSLQNIKKAFVGDLLFENLSFTLNHDDRLGLIGSNGVGKTSLFKIILKELDYDTGICTVAKGLTIGSMEQEVSLHSDLTLYDYCLEAYKNLLEKEAFLTSLEDDMAKYEDTASMAFQRLMQDYHQELEAFETAGGYLYRSQIKGILMGLGFQSSDFERHVSSLSGGQFSRLRLARLLMQAPELMLLDEPTNHLDLTAVAWLEAYLRQYPKAFIVISHDRYFLDQVTTRTVEITPHHTFDYEGNYSIFQDKKSEWLRIQERALDKQMTEMRRQQEIIRKFRQHKTEKLAKRARSRELALEKQTLITPVALPKAQVHLQFNMDYDSGQDALLVQDLKKSFDAFTVFDHVDFQIFKGEKIGIIGPNGCGKSTLLKILTHEIEASGGDVKWGHQVKWGYFEQDFKSLNPLNDLIEEIQDAYPQMNSTEVRTHLGSMLFTGDDVFKPIGKLSGGEKNRVTLLKLILSKSNFLLLDEPTNHLDIQAKEALEAALSEYPGTILSVSHDRYYLNQLCEKIIELSPEGAMVYWGNYEDYVQKKKLMQTPEPDDSTLLNKTQLKNERKKDKAIQQTIKDQKAYIKALEVEIEETENAISAIEHALCDPAFYTDSTKTITATQNLTKLKAKLETVYNQWHEALEDA